MEYITPSFDVFKLNDGTSVINASNDYIPGENELPGRDV